MRTHQRLQRQPESHATNPRPLLRRHPISPDPIITENFDRITELPRDHSTARALRQGAVLQMQQTRGNAAVRRMLTGTAIGAQRQPSGDISGPKTFSCPDFAGVPKLEACLNDKDRLRSGDSDKVLEGSPVARVQKALMKDEPTALPKFGADGTYGSETSQAVKDFKKKHDLGFTGFGDVGPGTMSKLDELCSSGPGPKPKPEPQPPQPTPTDNTQLEDEMDNIWLQHQILLKRQDDGLSRLESDLANQEKPTDLAKEIVKFVTKAAFDALFGAGSGFIRDAVIKALAGANMSSDDQSLVKDKGITPIFDAAKDAADKGIDGKVDDIMDHGGGSLETFIDSQRSIVTDASAEAQEVFLTQTKAALRRPASSAPGDDPTVDPRVLRARKYANSVKSKRTNAFEMQYRESLQKYAVGQAQSQLGVTPNPAKFDQEGTNLTKDKVKNVGIGNLKGVLILDVDGDEPNKPVKVKAAKIMGLSQKTRDHLTKEDPSLEGLSFPMVASGKVNKGFSPLDLKFFNSSITIGRNETDQTFEIDSSDGGKEWLKAKAANQNKILPPEDAIKVDEEHGAIQTFDEIGSKTLKQLGVTIEKA